MSALTVLDVVNDSLALMGEAPLNEIDDDHPFVAAVLRDMKSAMLRELGTNDWWFNTEVVTLNPDPDSGYVYAPGDTLSIDPVDKYLPYVFRSRRLYNAQAETYNIGAAVKCKLVREVPFEDLPSNAQLLVSLSTQVHFQRNIDADQNKMQGLTQEYKLAYARLNSENIRNWGSNLLYKNSTLSKFSRLGNRYTR